MLDFCMAHVSDYRHYLPREGSLRLIRVLVHASGLSVTRLGKPGENPYYLKAQKKHDNPTNWNAIRQRLEGATARETTVLTCTSAEMPREGLGSR